MVRCFRENLGSPFPPHGCPRHRRQKADRRRAASKRSLPRVPNRDKARSLLTVLSLSFVRCSVASSVGCARLARLNAFDLPNKGWAYRCTKDSLIAAADEFNRTPLDFVVTVVHLVQALKLVALPTVVAEAPALFRSEAGKSVADSHFKLTTTNRYMRGGMFSSPLFRRNI